MSEIRGLIFHSRLDYLQKHLNGGYLKTIREKLSPSTQQIISDQIFWVNTYPFEALRELDTALIHTSGKSETELYSEMGREFADTMVERYFYNYVESAEPGRFLQQFQRLYPSLWGFGSVEVHLEEAGKAELLFNFDEDVLNSFHYFSEAFLIRALEICGGSQVQCRRTSVTDSGAERFLYSLTWS